MVAIPRSDRRDRIQDPEVALKVLHVIPSVAARYGGPSEVAVRMIAELRRAGVEVSLATTDADGTGRLAVRNGALQDFGGVPAIFFPRQFSEAFKYSRPLSRWLSEHAGDFDCVHVHGVFSHSSFAAARACRRRGIPYVVRPLGALEAWSLRQKPVRKRVTLALGGRRMLREAAAIHYTTGRERIESERMLGLSNGVVIPLGVDMPASPNRAIEQSRNRAMPPTILFLSRLHPKKGLEILLDAFDNVANDSRFRECELVIAGDGDGAYAASLRERASRKASRERIRFVGWLDGDRKAAALAAAELFVLPSAQENFGLAALEAMAVGVPVAVSRAVDLSDEIEAADAGWVFERTVSGLSAALMAALADRVELRRRGENGRQIVRRKFLWPVIAEDLKELYRAILALAPQIAQSSNRAIEQ